MPRGRVIDRDRGFRALRQRFRRLRNAGVKVGVLQGAGAYDDAGEDGLPRTIAQVAVWNEFGTSDGKVPERPAFRRAVDKPQGKRAVTNALTRASKEVVDGAPVDAALGRVGLVGQTLVRRSITELDDPPNAPATVEAKGSSNPLIDTGTLRQSVTFEVVKGGKAKKARAATVGNDTGRAS